MTAKGRNVWFDLMTTDVDGAKAFYTETIGWKSQQWEEGDPNMPYSMWMAGEVGIGGLMQLPEEAAKMGAPPHWMAYTLVPDVDATVKEAEGLGGKILKSAFDIPKVGRVAVLADPQGAAFAIYKPEKDDSPFADGKQMLQFSWAELNTTDYEGAWKFYSALFDWKERSTMDMGPLGTYFMWNDSEEVTKGGMSNMASQMKVPAHWLHYITVENIEETLERIKAKGGKVINGPMDIPGDDVIAQCIDPQGAFFAVYAEGKKK